MDTNYWYDCNYNELGHSYANTSQMEFVWLLILKSWGASSIRVRLR